MTRSGGTRDFQQIKLIFPANFPLLVCTVVVVTWAYLPACGETPAAEKSFAIVSKKRRGSLNFSQTLLFQPKSQFFIDVRRGGTRRAKRR